MTENARAVDWTDSFITPDWDEDTARAQPSPHFRQEFEAPGDVASATLHITALGAYRAEINGARVGDEVLRPGWTSYRHRLCYQTYDVAELVQPGINELGVVVADGWARGNPVDSLLTLRYDAGLSANTGECPEMGQVVEVQGASPHTWGDVDCGGTVNPVDSLKLLRHDAGLSVSQGQPCTGIGTTVAIAES